MIGAAGPRPVPSGLAARIIGFLSIALVPLGVVAYLQTAQLGSETRARTELSLVTLTESAAAGERESILRALGNAQALGATIGAGALGDAACSATMRGYLNAAPDYSFVGLLPTDGVMTCNSAGVPIDLREIDVFDSIMTRPRSMVSRNDTPTVSADPVLVVLEPFYRDDGFAGYVILSLPASGLRRNDAPEPDSDLRELLTFNAEGQVLSSRSAMAQARQLLPETLQLDSLVGAEAHSFRARSADGTEYIFAVTPLVPRLVYALSVWPENSRAASAVELNRATQVLPFVMWVASVVVAFLAINRLVIRHIKSLSQKMRGFARNRQLPKQAVNTDMALELRDMEVDFQYMAEAILQDEAKLENALREKTVLLKEVHHRVKNNLQLISSIMNMQIRQSTSDETRLVLRRLQDRIRGLATIHRNLYVTEDLGHVNAGKLLDDLIHQMAVVADAPSSDLALETHLEEIEVYPDQAVPLSLLTAEALTNAGKYMGPDSDGRRRLSVSFRMIDDQQAEIDITNSCALDGNEQEDSTGLGQRLIRAFATQLGGDLTQGVENGHYRVRVRFTLSDFQPETMDY